MHPDVIAPCVHGVKETLVARQKEIHPQLLANKGRLLRPPIVSHGKAVHRVFEPPAYVFYQRELDIDNVIGQSFHRRAIQHQVAQYVFKAVQGVHTLKEDHKDAYRHVLALPLRGF